MITAVLALAANTSNTEQSRRAHSSCASAVRANNHPYHQFRHAYGARLAGNQHANAFVTGALHVVQHYDTTGVCVAHTCFRNVVHIRWPVANNC
jgi:hypothetical protein